MIKQMNHTKYLYKCDKNKIPNENDECGGGVVGDDDWPQSLISFNFYIYFFRLWIEIDRDPGQDGFTGVTIRGEDNAIASAKSYIQELVAAK